MGGRGVDRGSVCGDAGNRSRYRVERLRSWRGRDLLLLLRSGLRRGLARWLPAVLGQVLERGVDVLRGALNVGHGFFESSHAGLDLVERVVQRLDLAGDCIDLGAFRSLLGGELLLQRVHVDGEPVDRVGGLLDEVFEARPCARRSTAGGARPHPEAAESGFGAGPCPCWCRRRLGVTERQRRMAAMSLGLCMALGSTFVGRNLCGLPALL